MKAGEKVKFSYTDEYGLHREQSLVLSGFILSEEKMSDEEVEKRLVLKLQAIPMERLVEMGVIFAARNLLRLCEDAHEIDLRQKEKKNQPEEDKIVKPPKAGAVTVILTIIAVVAAILSFPLLVMLGMRGKLFLKNFYPRCQGKAYGTFVKIYTYVGVGLYAVFAILILIYVKYNIQTMIGPAFGILFVGGVAYFILSLVIVKKVFHALRPNPHK